MPLALTTTRELSVDDLRKAIELRFSRCFPALNLANALGGYQSAPWQAVREFTPVQLIADAVERGVPLDELECAVTHEYLPATSLYRLVYDKMFGPNGAPRSNRMPSPVELYTCREPRE